MINYIIKELEENRAFFSRPFFLYKKSTKTSASFNTFTQLGKLFFINSSVHVVVEFPQMNIKGMVYIGASTLDPNLFRRIWESLNLFLSKFSCVEKGSEKHHT